jgi:ribosomal protein S18 acetylase RimI-like enzyme
MIHRIEEFSMNAWPSLETELYDGWVIRFSKGYTKRANSINPLYSSTINTEDKILKCENLFHSRKLPVVYKMTPNSVPSDLDDILDKEGYKLIDTTSVQLLKLDTTKEPTHNNIVVYNTPDENWIHDYCTLNKVDYENMDTLRIMLNSIKPTKFFISLLINNKVVSCGLGVLEGEYIGLFDLIVDSKYRGQGYGEQLILNLLKLGKKNNAKYSYLQVVKTNIPAVRLYSKLGFKEHYKYWYRVKL